MTAQTAQNESQRKREDHAPAYWKYVLSHRSLQLFTLYHKVLLDKEQVWNYAEQALVSLVENKARTKQLRAQQERNEFCVSVPILNSPIPLLLARESEQYYAPRQQPVPTTPEAAP